MARLKVTLLFALALTLTAAGPRQGLFLDISGSMRHYHAEGVVANLAAPLQAALRAEGEIQVYGFNEQVRRFPSVEAVTPGLVGGFTHLGRTVEQAQRDGLPLFWIITDNLEHREGESEGEGTDQFFRQLRGSLVQRVTVFPVALEPGRPGLVVYAILLDRNSAAAYEGGIAGYQRNARGLLQTDGLRMKPLDRDTVDTMVVPRQRPGQRSGREIYKTGEPISKTIDVKFRSKLDHVVIVDSQIDVVNRTPQFQESSILVPDEKGISISPRQIKELLPRGQTQQDYEVVLELNRLRLKPGFKAMWDAAFVRNSEEARLNVGFLIRVPRTNFRLHPDFLGKYHAVTPAEARATGRIYALDRLPTLMNDETTSVAVNHEIKMVVKYPLYPTLIMIALGLLLVAVIWLAVMGLRRLAPAARSRWNVFLVDDTRSAEMVGTKVVLGDEEVGSVVSDRFIPSGRAALANGQAEAVLVDGAIVDLRILHRLTRVRFEVKGKKKQKQAAAPAAPDDIPRR